MNRSKTSIRAEALNRLAKFAAGAEEDNGTLSKLTAVLENPRDDSSIAMSGKEFEVLISLARAAEHITSQADAQKLVHQLGRYLLESPAQNLVNSPTTRRNDMSPWHVETDLLTRAMLQLMTKFEPLKDDAVSYILGYLESIRSLWSQAEGLTKDLSKFFPFLFSFQGFLEALATSNWLLCKTPKLTLTLMKTLMEVVDSQFLLKVEAAVSSHITADGPQDMGHANVGLWLWSFNRYQEKGLHVGAMLLSWYLCQFFRAIAETFVEDGPKGTRSDIDDYDRSLIDSLLDIAKPLKLSETEMDILDLSKKVAVNQIESLDEGADYIELASPAKINLALTIKAAVLEIIAVAIYYDKLETTVAIKYIESSLTHKHAMTDRKLALSVFKLGAFICYKDESMGPSLTRFLPHFVANTEVSPNLVWESNKALVKGFHVLSQDVVVSMIYTLVNSLVPESDFINSPVNGNGDPLWNHALEQYSSTPSGGVDVSTLQGKPRTHAYKNIVTAIVSIAVHYADNEITILASTVLTQKLNNVSRKVDREVLLGLSKLVVYLSEREMKLVLKNYSALEANALKQGETEVVETVS